MANPRHVSIVERGPEAIAKWRARNPGAKLDLHEADFRRDDLRRADLRGADLAFANLPTIDFRGANLRSADLEFAVLEDAMLDNADLTGASLFGTDLKGATLSMANLTDVVLQEASLAYADLSLANLTRAELTEANLAHAVLKGAILEGALLDDTMLTDTNLADAVGLDHMEHRGPSAVDHRTMEISGNLPREFLSLCGMPEGLLDAMLVFLRPRTLRFVSCFISYSSGDEAFVGHLFKDLQNRGVPCWYAKEHLRTGDRVRSSLERAIRSHDKLLLVLSKHSVRSAWVETEVEAAFDKERRTRRTMVLPIMLDNSVMKTNKPWVAEIRRTRHVADFTRCADRKSYHKSLRRLLMDLIPGDRRRRSGA